MRIINQSRHKKGMTIIEALVAVFVLALSIGGGSKMVVMTMKLSDLAKDKNTAVNLAKNRIERISVSDFDDFPMWRGSNVVSNSQGNPDTEGQFQIDTEVTYIQTNLAEVVIQVRSRNRVSQEFDRAPELITTRIADLQGMAP